MHDSAITALTGGHFKSCLSENIVNIFRKCKPNKAITHCIPISSGGGIDVSALPHDLHPDSPEFYALFHHLCDRSWDFWRHLRYSESIAGEKIDGTMFGNSSDVMYLSLQHSTLLEKCILFLVVGDRGSVLLKDALQDSCLLDHFSPLFIKILKFVFVPSGLNFRNVIRHGFMAPCEVNPKLCALLMSLHLTVKHVLDNQDINPDERVDTQLSTSQGVFQGHDTFTHFFSLFDFADLIPQSDTSVLSNFLGSCFFVLPERETLVMSAIVDYSRGHFITCLVKVIPCLEHSLRLLFCLANQAEEFMMADVGVYYSTLDGFGQRSKHQLLLDPYMFDYNREKGTHTCTGRNKLLPLLGEGFYALLVDLFFADTGPNVRARLAHGINVSYDNQLSCPMEGGREMANAVLALYFSMCMKFYQYRPSSESPSCQSDLCASFSSAEAVTGQATALHSHILSFVAVCDFWKSLYHPNRVLARCIQQDSAPCLHQLRCLAQKRMDVFLSSVHLSEDAAHFPKSLTASDGCNELVRIKISRGHGPSFVNSSSSQIIEMSDRRSRLFSNFLYAFDSLTYPGSIVSISSPCSASEIIRRDMKSRSVGTLSYDVVQSCTRLTAALADDVLSVVDIPDGADMMTPLLQYLNSFPARIDTTYCNECSGQSCEYCVRMRAEGRGTGDNEECGTSAEHEQEGWELSLDCFLSRHCGTSAQPLHGLPCCFSILKQLTELCTRLHESILLREELVATGQSHTGDRRQYLLQLMCLSPVVQSLASLVLSVLLSIIYLASPNSINVNVPLSFTSDRPTSAQTFVQSEKKDKFTPLLAGISAAISSFGSCIFTSSATQTSKKNPEQSLATLHKFLSSKVVVQSVSQLIECLKQQESGLCQKHQGGKEPTPQHM